MTIWRYENCSKCLKNLLFTPTQKLTIVSGVYFCAQRLKHTESDKLKVQIQAYLDNLFDVGTLLEDAETKNAALERVEELEENLSHVSEYSDTILFFLSFLELIACSFLLIFRIIYIYIINVSEFCSIFPPSHSVYSSCWQMSDKLLETENEAMSKIVELEKQLMQKNKELDTVRVSMTPPDLEPRSIFWISPMVYINLL